MKGRGKPKLKVESSAVRAQGSKWKVQSSEFRVQSSEFNDQSLRCKIQGPVGGEMRRCGRGAESGVPFARSPGDLNELTGARSGQVGRTFEIAGREGGAGQPLERLGV